MKKTAMILVLISTFAFAQDVDADSSAGQAQAAPSSGKRTRPGKTVYDFNEVDILGRLKRPDAGIVTEKPQTEFDRLFDINESFLNNIIRSVDDY